MNLVDPSWTRRACLTAVIVMVSEFRPETSVTTWREAGDAILASGEGAGAVCAVYQGAAATGDRGGWA